MWTIFVIYLTNAKGLYHHSSKDFLVANEGQLRFPSIGIAIKSHAVLWKGYLELDGGVGNGSQQRIRHPFSR